MNTRDLKSKARILLTGHYGFFALLTLILMGFKFLMNTVIDYAFPGEVSGFGSLMCLVCSVLSNMLYTILLAGMYRIYLNHMRGTACSLKDLTFAFGKHPEQVAAYSVIQYLVSFIFAKTLSWYADSIFYSYTVSSFLFRLPVLLLVTVFTLSTFLSLAPGLYLYCDSPWKTAGEFIQEGIQLMKGNRFRLLRLQLSFIGLELLNLLSLGIATLFIQPYLELSQVLFYENLIADKNEAK